MTHLTLLLRSLVYYWRTNLAVLLGVIAGTAVIGGALVVGDSVRDSLRQMSLERLGDVDHAMSSHRFFREDLANELAETEEFQAGFDAIAPALALRGSLEAKGQANDTVRRAGSINVYGIDERFWSLFETGELTPPTDRGVALSRQAAEQLSVAVGDSVTLWIEIPSNIPRDTLLGDREETVTDLVLEVTDILPDELGLSRFSVLPNQQLPSNAFVPLTTLQSRMGLGRERDRRARRIIPPRVNALFAHATGDRGAEESAKNDAAELTATLDRLLTPFDLGLRFVEQQRGDVVALESQQMILEGTVAEKAICVAEEQEIVHTPVLVYLANQIDNASHDGTDLAVNDDEKLNYSMYSIVAGLDFTTEDPFGPFEFIGDAPEFPLARDQIVLNDWLAKDLSAEVGDRIRLRYHEVGAHGELPEVESMFTLAGIVKLTGPAADSGLTPYVKGITDVETFDDWDQLFPMENDRITTRDELYWEDYRATPKAFLPLATAQVLWKSRYGDLTSIRLAIPDDAKPAEFEQSFTENMLGRLQPSETGLVFQPVKAMGLQAASGTTDFSGLFIGFSFFLILSAMILLGLLFRLGIERRVKNLGLLSAVGLTPQQVKRQLYGEGLVIVLVGGLIGCYAAVQYAELMVYGLRTWWVGAIGTRFLFVSVHPLSLLIGFVIAAVVSLLAIWWALRQLDALSTRALLQGESERSLSSIAQQGRSRLARRGAIVCGATAVIGLVAAFIELVPASEAFFGLSWQTLFFFFIGMLMLAFGVLALSAWLDRDRESALSGNGTAAALGLGMRNAARSRQRSLLTVGLIASATFVIVAVAAGQRNPSQEAPTKDSGNGGYLLVAETSTPILQNLNTEQGRRDVGLTADSEDEGELLDEIDVQPFRVRPGEDASCLNLYQTTLPTVLGVPDSLVDRGGFKFANASTGNPWELLNEPTDDGTIPVMGDLNTLMFSLKKQIGDTISVPTEENPRYTLKIVGMLDSSVFQGVLLMSTANFEALYPEESGFDYFLVEGPTAKTEELTDLLETKLAAYGFDAERTVDRIAGFLAVQNTYLSTFQTLGGLGLLLGTLGLATVMLRNVLERRSELALLRAVGFRRSGLASIVLWENGFLLLWGLVTGTVAALVAMLPHLRTVGADVPFGGVSLLLGGVFILGMLAALVAVIEAIRTPILSTLRAE